MQFLIRELAFMTTVISLDTPKSPLKKRDFEQISGSPLLKDVRRSSVEPGARGDLTRLLHK